MERIITLPVMVVCLRTQDVGSEVSQDF